MQHISSRWHTCCYFAPGVHLVQQKEICSRPQATTYGCGLWRYTESALHLTGGTPQVVVISCIGRSQCSTSIANSNAPQIRCGALVMTVRCLHLTVNSQWKLFTFTPKRSFGLKHCTSGPSPEVQYVKSTCFAGGFHFKLVQPLRAGPVYTSGLTA